MDSNPDELRNLLRAHADKIPPSLQRLGDALWNPDDEQLSHAACRAALPEFVDAELAGDAVAKLYPAVKHHLDRCDECGREYAELLDTAWAEQRGALVKPRAMPRPDLSFLPQPPSTRSLPEIVLEWTRRLLPTFAPGRERELAVIADTFFTRVAPLKTFELRAGAVQAMGLGRRETSPALETLAACYVATQQLVSQTTRQELDAWLAQGTFAQNVETRARDAAQQIGIPRKQAASFARAYAAQIAQDPSALKELLQ
ncbi:MAG: hypothetical protein HY741_23805 [Chloroflexi bacterium]|nr:hypothetical protein [Chloroflexota bacterium]